MPLPLTPVAFDQIRQRYENLVGQDIWIDGDEYGDEIRADLGELIRQVEYLQDQVAQKEGIES